MRSWSPHFLTLSPEGSGNPAGPTLRVPCGAILRRFQSLSPEEPFASPSMR